MNTTLSTSRAYYLGDRKRMEHLGWKCLVMQCWARCQDKVPHSRQTGRGAGTTSLDDNQQFASSAPGCF